jgi:hypothetical protein
MYTQELQFYLTLLRNRWTYKLLYTTQQAIEFTNLQRQHWLFKIRKFYIVHPKNVYVEICAIHYEETVSILIAEITTQIAN